MTLKVATEEGPSKSALCGSEISSGKGTIRREGLRPLGILASTKQFPRSKSGNRFPSKIQVKPYP